LTEYPVAWDNLIMGVQVSPSPYRTGGAHFLTNVPLLLFYIFI
jgi:hypothetical protein